MPLGFVENCFMKINLSENKPIYFILTALFVFLIIINYFDNSLLWDENAYLANARNFLRGSNYTEDFRFPLLSFLIASLWSVFGETVLSAKLLIMGFAMASVYLFYFISFDFFGKKGKTGLLCTIVFGFSGLVLYWGFRVYTDIPAMFFILLSFRFMSKENTSKNTVIAGVSASLAFLMRFPFALFGVSVLAYFAYKKEFRHILLFLVAALITLVPWLSYNYLAHNGDFIYDFKGQFAIVAAYTKFESPLNHISNFLYAMNILALFLPAGFYSYSKSNDKLKPLVLTYFALFVAYFFFLANMKISRYIIPFLPFAYIISIKGVELFNKKFVSLICAASLLLGLLLVLPLIYNGAQCNSNNVVEKSINYVCPQKENSQKKILVSNYWPYFGYACNFKVKSFWNPNLQELINAEKPDYIVYSPQLGDFYDKILIDANPKIVLEKKISSACGEEAYIYRVANK